MNLSVVVRCQSYPGTFQFSCGGPVGSGTGTEDHPAPLPSAEGRAHFSFKHAGRRSSVAIFVDGVVARVSGKPGAFRAVSATGTHGRLPAIKFIGAVLRLLRNLSIGNARFQAGKQSSRCTADVFHVKTPSASASHEHQRLIGAEAACAEKLSIRSAKS